MFPHAKLEWTLKSLERQLEATPDDVAARLEYTRACYARARYHEGGETWYSQTLRQARRVLEAEPNRAEAMILAGLAYLGLERSLDSAVSYLDKASRLAPDRSDLHFALAQLEESRGALHLAVQEYETAVTGAPESWEAHYALGAALGARAKQIPDNRRILERSQYHMVRALELGPSDSVRAPLLLALGIACVHARRYDEGHKLFTALLAFDSHRAAAHYYLGLSSFHLGRFQNANLNLRKHMDAVGENAEVLTLLATSYLSMGQLEKARSAASRAQVYDAHNPQPDFILATALLADGAPADALALLKKVLRGHPDHMEAYIELARHHRDSGNTRWLFEALRTEVAGHDGAPHNMHLSTGRTPRQVVRARVRVILQLLGEGDEERTDLLLSVLPTTEDEGLRAELWETALGWMAQMKAREVAAWLEAPGKHFSPSRAREVLLVAERLPERALITGLQITESDLQAAAVERFGSHFDIATHRQNVERLREEARAWQALLLLAIATHDSPSGRNLLARWAREADAELVTAAQAALVMMGEPGAASELELRSAQRGSVPLLQNLRNLVSRAAAPQRPRPVAEGEAATCSSCGRKTTEVSHMLAGRHAVLCDRCMGDIAHHRVALAIEDPSIPCSFCDRTVVEARAVYAHHGTPICSTCLDTGLGLVEREVVDHFLSSL